MRKQLSMELKLQWGCKNGHRKVLGERKDCRERYRWTHVDTEIEGKNRSKKQ